MSISAIPVEVLAIITEEFGVSEYLACGRVSKDWRRVFTCPYALEELVRLYGAEEVDKALINAQHQGRPLKWSRFNRCGQVVQPILRGHYLLHNNGGIELLNLMTHEAIRYNAAGLPALSEKIVCFAGDSLLWAKIGHDLRSIAMNEEVLAIDAHGYSVAVLTRGSLNVIDLETQEKRAYITTPPELATLFAVSLAEQQIFYKNVSILTSSRGRGWVSCFQHEVTIEFFGGERGHFFDCREENGDALFVQPTGNQGELALQSGYTMLVADLTDFSSGHFAAWKDRIYRRANGIETELRGTSNEVSLICAPPSTGPLLVNDQFLVDYGKEIYVYAFDPKARGQELKTGDKYEGEPVFKWPESESMLWNGEEEDDEEDDEW